MRHSVRRVCLVCILLITTLNLQLTSQSRPAPTRPSVTDMSRSVVKIEVDRLDGSASGSGVIVDPSGVIATAAHVIAGATAARVRLSSGETMKVEGLIEADADLDLALIRTESHTRCRCTGNDVS